MAKEAPDYSVDPHLSPAVKAFLKPLNAGGPAVESLSEQDAREVLLNLQVSVKVDLSGVDESEKTITQVGCTVKLTVVRPKGNKEKLPVFIFTHGGGWVLGDYPTHKRLVRDLVVASECAAVFVNYTLSPEAHYPQAIHEIYAAAKWVSEHGDEIRKEKYASPLQSSLEELKDLPPTLIQVAENDILRDEGEAYGRKLEQAGVKVLSVRYNGMIHDFGMLNGLAETTQVRGLIELAAAELKKHLH